MLCKILEPHVAKKASDAIYYALEGHPYAGTFKTSEMLIWVEQVSMCIVYGRPME